MADLIVQAGNCSIVCRSDFETASSVFALQMMRAADCDKVLSIATRRWLSSDYRSGVVSGHSSVRKCLVMVDGRSKFVSLPPALEPLSFLPASK